MRDKFDRLRCADRTAVRALKQKVLAWKLDGPVNKTLAASVEGALLGNYEPEIQDLTTRNRSKRFTRFALNGAEVRLGLSARIFAECQISAAIGLRAANIMTPMLLADRARDGGGIAWNARPIKTACGARDGLAAGRGAGSAESPPVVIRYKPRAPKSSDHLGLVAGRDV